MYCNAQDNFQFIHVHLPSVQDVVHPDFAWRVSSLPRRPNSRLQISALVSMTVPRRTSTEKRIRAVRALPEKSHSSRRAAPLSGSVHDLRKPQCHSFYCSRAQGLILLGAQLHFREAHAERESQRAIHLIVLVVGHLLQPMGSATGGARGPWPPPQILLGGGGANNAFGPPQILGKILLCTLLIYSVFFEKKTMECIHNSVHFIKIF